MNLKIRLALLYSLSVLVILVVSAVSIYVLNENFRKEEFIKRLSLKAKETYTLFYGNRRLPTNVANGLNNGFHYSLPEENVSLFDSAYHLIYTSPGSHSLKIPRDYFKLAKKRKQYTFTIHEREALILFTNQKGKSIFVLASGTDIFGHRKGDNLKIALVFSVMGGFLLSGFLAFFYVKQAMKPLEELKEQIEKINEENLQERIFVDRDNNEMKQIAKKFNAMLDRLEQAFEQRRNFVQHASHELRTPLATMLSQTEAALSKDLSIAGYRTVLFSLKEEQQDLINLTNSLLTLSKYEKMTQPKDWTLIRIDEVLYDTVDIIKQVWPDAKVTIEFEGAPENEEELVFKGSESLLRSALQNLVKNGLQYSENLQMEIIIKANSSGITLTFNNRGKPLSEEEQNRLFIPFFRGENSQNKKGYGLGLSIVKRIMNVHKGSISYEAMADNTNSFTLFFPGK
ncbi:MAG: two-component sensor histidine kinase [Segetibacter sp.]|jgi:signal transduction histidine kinase|nr:two-component sensor histidine kinase [Segetibacter sp.]